jgi:hypothetical protein
MKGAVALLRRMIMIGSDPGSPSMYKSDWAERTAIKKTASPSGGIGSRRIGFAVSDR